MQKHLGAPLVAGQQEHIHIVLVEPSEALNVGSAARAMANLGFRKLHLVNPINYSRQRAAVTACWADSLLDTLSVHQECAQVLGPMKQVVGFSARTYSERAEYLDLDRWIAEFANEPVFPTALLFGPEDNGLRAEHLEQCRWIVRLPSSKECGSFNLAQAVLLALYELRRALHTEISSQFRDSVRNLPTWNEFQQLDRLIELVATQSGFYHRGTPAPLFHHIKNLMRRMDPNEHEMRVLLGFFNRMESVISGRVPGAKVLSGSNA